MNHFITLLAWVLPINIEHQLLCKDLTKMFSRMVLRLVKKLLFAVIAEFICYNDIYKMKSMAIIYTPPDYYHDAPLFLVSCLFCFLLFLFHRERHTPCRSGLSLYNWNTFYFFEKKKKKRNELEVAIRLHSYQEMLPDW